MRISIFGTGYVGSVPGICLADLGHDAIFTNIDTSKMEFDQGLIPVFESGLRKIFHKNHERISTIDNSPHAVENSDISFICVKTPSMSDSSLNRASIPAVRRNIGRGIQKKNTRIYEGVCW
jgi:UDPglucose 6-dehydrogenase